MASTRPNSSRAEAAPGPNWLLLELRLLRVEQLEPCFLELGCREGSHLALAASEGWQVFGVEFREDLLLEASRRLPTKTCLVPELSQLPPLRPDLILIGPHALETGLAPSQWLQQLVERQLLKASTVLLAPRGRGWKSALRGAGFRTIQPQESGRGLKATGWQASETEEQFFRLRQEYQRLREEVLAGRAREGDLRRQLRELQGERERLVRSPSFQLFDQVRNHVTPLESILGPPLRLAKATASSFWGLPTRIRTAWETSAEPVWPSPEAPPQLRRPARRLIQQFRELLLPRRNAPSYQAPAPEGTSRPRVLHALPDLHAGGSTQLVVDLLRGLHSEYYQEVLTSSLSPGVSYSGMKIHLHPRPASLDELRWLLREGRFGLIHLHYWGAEDEPWYQLVLAAAEEEGLPVLLNVNTPVAPCTSTAIEARVFASDWLRTHSSPASTTLPQQVIPPGIDLGHFEPLRLLDPDAPEPADVVGVVSRLESDRLDPDALDGLTELVRLRPRTQVVVIGRGDLLPVLTRRVRVAGLREHFDFRGAVPYSDLPAWYRRFTVFVAPLARVGFARVVPFAMASGLPVAGTRVGPLEEILGGSQTLARDPNELAQIVQGLLDNGPRRRELGDQNLARARKGFPVETMIESYRRRYRQLLQSRQR